MKKIITTILFTFLLSTNAYSQERNDFNNELSTAIVKENTKNIGYNITILKNEKILYSSKLLLRNSKIIPIFYLEENNQKEQLNETGKGLNKSFSINEINVNQAIEKEVYQLKLIIHLEKKTNNMWSILFIQDLESKKNEDINNLIITNNSQEIKGLILNKSPKNENLKKQLIILHQNNQETKMAWKDYLFIIKADVK